MISNNKKLLQDRKIIQMVQNEHWISCYIMFFISQAVAKNML